MILKNSMVKSWSLTVLLFSLAPSPRHLIEGLVGSGFMKKILGIVVLCLLLSSNVNSKTIVVKANPEKGFNFPYLLKTSEDSITGKFKLNFANKPSVTIDRYSGVLSYKGLGTSFTGECKKVDRTKKKF